MGAFTLFLFSYGRDTQELELHPHSMESSIVDTMKPTENRVFNNYEYSGQLQSDDSHSITDFCLYLNGSFVQTEYRTQDGTFSIRDSAFGAKPFTECYGYIQLTVQFIADGEPYSLDTNYIPVMVRKGIQNDSVRRMADYVYHNNESLLFSNVMLPKDASSLKDSARKTIESRILLLFEIERVFESNYAYFKMNSRFTTVQYEHIDHFEKLQYISATTMYYISQHPNELQRTTTSAGIKVGKQHYQPDRTLITNNTQSFDIYENREIVGFLTSLYMEIVKMREEIENLIIKAPKAPTESGNYVISAFFIFASTLAALNSIVSALRNLQSKFAALFSGYSGIFHIKGNRVVKPSKPTAIFMSIPQYRQIYDCMNAWFKMGVVNLNEERYMLSFLKISSLYEVYVLLKLNNYFIENGYALTQTRHIQYQFSYKTFYKNTSCNNLYVFQQGEHKISVYYQPVIYNADHSDKTGIGLYRNTTISFPKWLDDESTGSYYTPDFLLKIENATLSSTKYVIADAKFSTTKNVKANQVALLSYKYLFSISPIDLSDTIAGLLIINGQSEDENDAVTDIYDKSLTPGKIDPQADILTLTENSTNNASSHSQLLKTVLGKYISY